MGMDMDDLDENDNNNNDVIPSIVANQNGNHIQVGRNQVAFGRNGNLLNGQIGNQQRIEENDVKQSSNGDNNDEKDVSEEIQLDLTGFDGIHIRDFGLNYCKSEDKEILPYPLQVKDLLKTPLGREILYGLSKMNICKMGVKIDKVELARLKRQNQETNTQYERIYGRLTKTTCKWLKETLKITIKFDDDIEKLHKQDTIENIMSDINDEDLVKYSEEMIGVIMGYQGCGHTRDIYNQLFRNCTKYNVDMPVEIEQLNGVIITLK